MKTILNKSLLTAAVLFTGIIGQAVAGVPVFGQDSGYWVVESNAQTRDFSIIKFYDSSHQLIYEEKLEGKYLDITRPRHKKMLNKSLKMLETNSLVASQLKGYQQQIAASLARKRE
jgi:hypothetical protein